MGQAQFDPFRWQRLQRETETPSRARFLAFHVEAPGGGHTVLEFWRAGRRFVFNPDMGARLRELSTRWTDEPIEVGRNLFSREVAARLKKARAFDLHPNAHHGEYAQIGELPANAGRAGGIF